MITMGRPFNFPDVGEGITEGKLVKWLVKAGDAIKADQALAEVETDKAVVEIPSPEGGTIEKLLFNEGDTMEVGKPMIELADGGGPAPAQEEIKEEAPKEEASAAPSEGAPAQAAPAASAPAGCCRGWAGPSAARTVTSTRRRGRAPADR